MINELSHGIWVSQLTISDPNHDNKCPYIQVKYNATTKILDNQITIYSNCTEKRSIICMYENFKNILNQSPCPDGWYHPLFMSNTKSCFTIKEISRDELEYTNISKINSNLLDFVLKFIAETLHINDRVLISVDNTKHPNSYNNWNNESKKIIDNSSIDDLDEYETLYDLLNDNWILQNKSTIRSNEKILVFLDQTKQVKPISGIISNGNTVGEIIVKITNDKYMYKYGVSKKPFFIIYGPFTTTVPKLVEYEIISCEIENATLDSVVYTIKLKEKIQTMTTFLIVATQFGSGLNVSFQNEFKIKSNNSTIYNVNMIISHPTFQNVAKLKIKLSGIMQLNNITLQDLEINAYNYETADTIDKIIVNATAMFVVNIHKHNVTIRDITDLFLNAIISFNSTYNDVNVTQITNENFCFDITNNFSEIQERNDLYTINSLMFYTKTLCLMEELDYPPYMQCHYNLDEVTSITNNNWKHPCNKNVDEINSIYYKILFNEPNITIIIKSIEPIYISTLSHFIYSSELKRQIKIKIFNAPDNLELFELYTILTNKLIIHQMGPHFTLGYPSIPFKYKDQKDLLNDIENDFIETIEYVLQHNIHSNEIVNTRYLLIRKIELSKNMNRVRIAAYCNNYHKNNRDLRFCEMTKINENQEHFPINRTNLLTSVTIYKKNPFENPKFVYYVIINVHSTLRMFNIFSREMYIY